jgi:hypothetical protein
MARLKPSTFDDLAARSRALHGHRYVLPLAVWILETDVQVASVREAMVGMGGRADRVRLIEALLRLTEFGALNELPRGPQRNATRLFERNAHPYWDFVEAYGAGVESRGGTLRS